MAIEKGNRFKPDEDDEDSDVIYEALSDPEREDEEFMAVHVKRIAGPDTITGIKHVEPGADWTDVKYVTLEVPVEDDFRADPYDPVILLP
jgi:hypothetical protein